jgi:hypothetical protein
MNNSPAAKSVRHVKCASAWNGYDFNVGLRYITLTRVYLTTDGKEWKDKSWKLDITQPIADRLLSIADLYPTHDANRVFAVVHQIFHAFHPNFTAE